MRENINDIERRVRKRTQKNIYKMDILYKQQVKYEDKKDERLAMLGQPDPVLNLHFKKTHAYNY